MTKQEEIKGILEAWADDCCLFLDRSCNALGSGYCSSSEEAYKCLMERLDKTGVVIKVGEIGNAGETDTHGVPCNSLCHNMERKILRMQGYVLVAPIKDTQ